MSGGIIYQLVGKKEDLETVDEINEDTFESRQCPPGLLVDFFEEIVDGERDSTIQGFGHMFPFAEIVDGKVLINSAFKTGLKVFNKTLLRKGAAILNLEDIDALPSDESTTTMIYRVRTETIPDIIIYPEGIYPMDTHHFWDWLHDNPEVTELYFHGLVIFKN